MSALSPQRYAAARAWAMVCERPIAFLLGVVLSGIALALPLSLASIGWAARPVLANMQPAPELSAFLATRASQQEVDALKARLAQVRGVVAVQWLPKEAALAQLARRSGFERPPAELESNPLPDVLVAQLALPIDPNAIETLAGQIRGWPLVDAVRTDVEWYRKLRALTRVLVVALALFGGLVLVLVGLILAGTIRLHAGTRADEVQVLKLVGATPRFIARPYAYSAALTLLTGAACAAALVWVAHQLLRGPIATLTELYGVAFTLDSPEPLHLAAVLLVAAVLGWAIGTAGARATLRGL